MPGRSLIVRRSLLPGGEGGLLPGGGGCVSAPGGSVCSWGVSALGECLSAWGGGVCSGGCLFREGGGVCVIPACTEADTPPCEQNDKQVQKYYLGHNFVAAGNNYACLFRQDLYLHEECTQRTNMSTYCCHVYCGTTTDVAY